jgi:hypothetical protein
VEVHNASSKLGFRWGHFLVTRSFGLAALGLVAFFVAWTLSRFIPKMRISLGKWFVYSFTGTFIGSWVLALISRLAGWDTLVRRRSRRTRRCRPRGRKHQPGGLRGHYHRGIGPGRSCGSIS